MNVNKYAWVNKMQMQRKGAYHHTMIRTEVQMVCEHWVVMWKTRTRACITWALAEFASTLYLASTWFQKIIQVHIISDEWSGTWWELCFLQNISPQWSDRHQCPRNMVWCICFTRFRSILFCLTWYGLLVYIYIFPHRGCRDWWAGGDSRHFYNQAPSLYTAPSTPRLKTWIRGTARCLFIETRCAWG